MNISGLDEKDNMIIKMLVDDARLNYSDIAEEVGLSRVAVKNRIKAIENEGIIKGYHAEIDPLVTPKMSTFVAVIKLRQLHTKKFLKCSLSNRVLRHFVRCREIISFMQYALQMI